MKRFWTLLLIGVMALQTSWAAVHLCHDATPGAVAVAAAFAEAGEQHQTSSAADQCCPVGHSCHSLCTFLPQGHAERGGQAVLSAPGLRAVPALPDWDGPRHERPQWSAA
ncbi:hypothetical protein AAFF27_14210 [Xylophilus sp. GW821-FHT01B05]